MFAIENVVEDVSLSQSGCEVSEDDLVMIDCGASVNVCPKWFGKSTLQKSDGSVLLRGADGSLAEDRKQPEKARLSFNGSDEANPECQVLVRTRNRNTPRMGTIPEVCNTHCVSHITVRFVVFVD